MTYNNTANEILVEKTIFINNFLAIVSEIELILRIIIKKMLITSENRNLSHKVLANTNLLFN